MKSYNLCPSFKQADTTVRTSGDTLRRQLSAKAPVTWQWRIIIICSWPWHRLHLHRVIGCGVEELQFCLNTADSVLDCQKLTEWTFSLLKFLFWSKTRRVVQSYATALGGLWTLEDSVAGYMFNDLIWCRQEEDAGISPHLLLYWVQVLSAGLFNYIHIYMQTYIHYMHVYMHSFMHVQISSQ